MSILMESNKLLREEKEKIEQELQQAQAKVSMLEHTLSLSMLYAACVFLIKLNALAHLLLVSVAKDGVRQPAAAAVQLRAK